MRRLAPLAALILTAVPLAAAPAAQASWTAPCIHGTKRPTCHWWTAKATFIADGDTIKVRVEGDGRVRRVRFTGINAMELHRYSKYPDRRSGDCHGLEATSLVEHYVRGSHWRVRLAAQHASSSSGGRLRRSVWVHSGGHWVDLGKIEMERGQALWLPNGDEYAHNLEYRTLAEEAAIAHRALYDPTYCGDGPDQDLPLKLTVNWDADSNDALNLNGEWITIRNLGTRDLSLRGWWVRDSFLRYSRLREARLNYYGRGHKPRRISRPPPGYAFSDDASVPAGGAIRLHIGCGRDTPSELHWCRRTSVFENVTYDRTHMGDGGYLFDPQGDLRALSIYPCNVDCADPLQGKVRLRVHPNKPEYMTLTNTSAGPIDLQGYILKLHLRGYRHKYVFGYQFGSDSVVPAGETMQVWVQGSPRNDAPLEKFIGRPQEYVLADGGNAVDLRTDSDVRIACYRWGNGVC